MLAALASMLPAAAATWTVLHNVDYPHNAPGAPGIVGPYLKAPNASACAEHCLAMADCAAIAWNGPRPNDPAGDEVCNFKCDDIPYSAPHAGQQAIVVRPGGRFCPKPPPPPCPAGEECWHSWAAATPPPDAPPMPFEQSTTLSHLEYSDTVSIPTGVGGEPTPSPGPPHPKYL